MAEATALILDLATVVQAVTSVAVGGLSYLVWKKAREGKTARVRLVAATMMALIAIALQLFGPPSIIGILAAITLVMLLIFSVNRYG